MSHITKQERIGLEDLFTAIDKHRYHSRWKTASRWIRLTHKQNKRFMMKSFKVFKG